MGAVDVLRAFVYLVGIAVKIPAVYIVHESVSVIVNAVSGNLILIDPYGTLQIRMGDVHACVYDRHGQGALCLCLGVGLPCWLDIDINSGNSINGAGQDIGRLQRGKGYGVYLSSFVSVYIGGVQGINIQFLDYFLRLAVIFKGPLVRGLVVLDGQVVEAGAYRIGGECVIRRIIGDGPGRCGKCQEKRRGRNQFFHDYAPF